MRRSHSVEDHSLFCFECVLELPVYENVVLGWFGFQLHTRIVLLQTLEGKLGFIDDLRLGALCLTQQYEPEHGVVETIV